MLIDCPLHKRAQQTPMLIAIRDAERSLTNAKLDELVNEYVGGLLQQGVSAGDYIAILSRNSIEYVALLIAIMRIHAIAVPLNIRLSAVELSRQLDSLDLRLLVTDFISREICTNTSCQLIMIDELHSGSRIESQIDKTGRFELDRTFTVCFTSGSDGNPKGVILTLGNHYYNALGSNENIALTTSDTWNLSLPLFHVGGLGIIFRCLLSGAQIYISQSFDPEFLNRQIDRAELTHLSLVPTMLARILESRKFTPFPKSLKTILVGGAPISAKLQEQIRRLEIPVVRSYGLTETASQITATQSHDYGNLLTTSGRPLQYRKVKIDATTAGVAGEICVKGEVLFKGYLGKADSSVDADGWFHTGDIGTIDDNGNLTVLGRKDEMFISGGENIFPQEIVDVVEQINGVAAAAVVPVSNETWGTRPIMFVEPAYGNELVQESLVIEMSRSLARYKLPDRIIVLEALPRTALGKIDRRALVKIAEAR